MNNWLSDIKLIAWDLDGTLYPSNSDLSDEINKVKLSKVSKHLGVSIKEAEKKFEELRKTIRSHTKTLDHLGIDGSNFFVNLWETLPLGKFIKSNPQLVKLLSKKGLPRIAMLTNSNSRKSIKGKLGFIGLNPEIFEFIITSVELGVNKPNPKIFQELIRQSGLSPSEIMYVGDREKVDIIPPKKLGIRTCIIGSESNEADLSFNTAVDLLKNFIKI